MATRTIANGGGNWSANGTWVEGVAPTSSDDVVATATSGNVVVTGTCVCNSADFTGYTGQLSGSAQLTINGKNANGDALKLVNTMTCTMTGKFTFAGTVSTTNAKVTTAGLTIGGILVSSSNDASSYLQQDDIHIRDNNNSFQSIRGIWDTQNHNIATDAVVCTGASNRTLTLGTSTIGPMSFAGTSWSLATTGLTFSAASSIIGLSGNNCTFAGGGATYGTVNLTGTGTATVTGANTVGTLSRSNAASVTLKLPASTTTTVTSALNVNGQAGTPVTLQSSSSGTPATLAVPAGTVLNHCIVKDIAFTGTTVIAYDSLDNTGNSGVTFVRRKTLAMMGAG